MKKTGGDQTMGTNDNGKIPGRSELLDLKLLRNQSGLGTHTLRFVCEFTGEHCFNFNQMALSSLLQRLVTD